MDDGIDLSKETPQYRLMSRALVNFILQHHNSPTSLRHLPAVSGFSKATVLYRNQLKNSRKKYLKDGIKRGIQLLVVYQSCANAISYFFVSLWRW